MARMAARPRPAEPPLAEALAEATRLANEGALADAAERLDRCLAADAENPAARRVRASVLLRRQRPAAAYEDYKLAAAAFPEDRDVWYEFAQCLMLIRQHEAARIAMERALRIGPPDFDMRICEGQIHHALRDADAAIAAFDAALLMRPGDIDAMRRRAAEFQMKGDFAAARDAYLEILERDPGFVEAHFMLAQMGEVAGREDAVVAGLEAAAADPAADETRRVNALFAAARIRKEEGRADAAFGLYARANAALRDSRPFDRKAHIETIDGTIAHFTAETVTGLAGAASDSEVPIFIVGMPRSGSTLVEQILSSHSAVDSAGEFHKLAQIVAALRSASETGRYVYPDDLGRMRAAALAPLAEDYLAALRAESRSSAGRITDKMLFNYLHLGLVAILFPGATVIHCRRDPRDIALSCFFQSFSSRDGMAFTNDLGDIGFVIDQYRRLMDHWRATLPVPMLEIDYEDLVADQEAVTRRMIDHCRLPWEDACLRPHENRREVRTASFWQVRQPVYRSSVGIWRDYERHLGPLMDELGD